MTLHIIVVISVIVLGLLDRKSTRLNSSHVRISYAVFCLKKKKKTKNDIKNSHNTKNIHDYITIILSRTMLLSMTTNPTLPKQIGMPYSYFFLRITGVCGM